MRHACLVYRHAVAVLVVCLAMPATAQQMATCTAVVAASGPLAAWSAPIDRAAAADAQQLTGAEIPLGQAQRLTLLPQDKVRFSSQPAKSGAAGSHGGLLRLTIGEAGTYQVALGTAAWIDVLDNGLAMAASAHGHGPACSGIHKLVDFPLHPGRYILQLSANAEPQTTVLVVRIP